MKHTDCFLDPCCCEYSTRHHHVPMILHLARSSLQSPALTGNSAGVELPAVMTSAAGSGAGLDKCLHTP